MKEAPADVALILTLALVVWLGYAVGRAILISWRARQEPRSAAEEFSRAEKIRQQIRRKRAERKAPPEAAPPPMMPPHAALRRRVPPLDPFGGPWWRRLRSWFGRRDAPRH